MTVNTTYTKIKHMLENQKSKFGQLDSNEKNKYETGLILFSTFVHEDFLDLPILPQDKYSTDGLFYNLPYLHDDILYLNGRTQMLLVVYRIQDGSSECPLRIEFEVTDAENSEFKIYLYDQSSEQTSKYTLIECHERFYSDREDLLEMTLSEIVAHFD